MSLWGKSKGVKQKKRGNEAVVGIFVLLFFDTFQKIEKCKKVRDRSTKG
jgi:hypothetical protein